MLATYPNHLTPQALAKALIELQLPSNARIINRNLFVSSRYVVSSDGGAARFSARIHTSPLGLKEYLQSNVVQVGKREQEEEDSKTLHKIKAGMVSAGGERGEGVNGARKDIAVD